MLTTIATPNEAKPARILWTKQDGEFLESGGLLCPGKYELVEGEIIPKMPRNRSHMRVITRIILFLAMAFGEENVFTQGTLEISGTSLPEPDGFAIFPAHNASLQVPTASEVAVVSRSFG